MNHPVLAFLQTNPVKALEAHGIYARWSTRNPRKFSLNYDQIEARDGDVLVEHCRGLVLRQDDEEGEARPQGAPGTYSILARPFRRFYNLGQEAAAVLDWSTARFEEKLDGTLCILYWDPDLGEACVATRSVPDADVLREDGRTFAEVFFEVYVYGKKAELPDQQAFYDWNRLTRAGPCTYLFELTGPGNQIVIPYDHWTTTLLGTVNNETGEVVPGAAKRYPFQDIEGASAWLQAQPGTSLEGFVVVDDQGNRVKVKNAQYLQVAKVMTTAGSEQGLVSIVLSGTADDVRQYLPKPRQARLDKLGEQVGTWLRDGQYLVESLSPSISRKDAALLVKYHQRYVSWIGTILDTWAGKYPSFPDAVAALKKGGVYMPSLVERVARDACGIEK